MPRAMSVGHGKSRAGSFACWSFAGGIGWSWPPTATPSCSSSTRPRPWPPVIARLRMPPRRFLAFRDAWAAGNALGRGLKPVRVAMIDDRLHAERVGPDRSKAPAGRNRRVAGRRLHLRRPGRGAGWFSETSYSPGHRADIAGGGQAEGRGRDRPDPGIHRQRHPLGIRAGDPSFGVVALNGAADTNGFSPAAL